MILVTGATGLVGSQMCRLLDDRGISYKALKRIDSDTSLCRDLEIQWLEGDVTDIVALDQVLEGIDTLIHCAAMVSFDARDKEQMMNINVNGTQNLINACLENDVKRFIHVSSIAALGRTKDSTTIKEESQWVDSSLNTNYAESKYLSELEVWRGQSEGLDVAIVNPSIVIAAADGKRSSSVLLQYIWDERKFFIDRHINFVDVRDVAEAILQIYSKSKWGHRYILNQGHMKYSALFSVLAQHLDKKPPKWNISIRLMKVGVLLSKIVTLITQKSLFISKELLKSMKSDYLYSNEKIKTDLQFEFTNTEETLEWACLEFLKIKEAN